MYDFATAQVRKDTPSLNVSSEGISDREEDF